MTDPLHERWRQGKRGNVHKRKLSPLRRSTDLLHQNRRSHCLRAISPAARVRQGPLNPISKATFWYCSTNQHMAEVQVLKRCCATGPGAVGDQVSGRDAGPATNKAGTLSSNATKLQVSAHNSTGQSNVWPAGGGLAGWRADERRSIRSEMLIGPSSTLYTYCLRLCHRRASVRAALRM